MKLPNTFTGCPFRFYENNPVFFRISKTGATTDWVYKEIIRIFIDKMTRVMTTKLTLTIEDSVIKVAKKYASRKGSSLSSLVENYLRSLTSREDKPGDISQAIKKRIGVISLPDDYDYKKELARGLEKKYRK